MDSEKKEHLNLNQLKAEKGVLKIIHQEEETPIVYYPSPVKLQGTIQAPGNFIEKRKTEHKALKSHVIYSYEGLYVKLRTEEDADNISGTPQAYYEVSGKLQPNPQINNLRVNTKGGKMGVKEMIDLLKFNRFFFADKSQNQRIIENLANFSVTAESTIQAADDKRGNIKDVYEIKNKSNIDLTFDLLMPVYVGQPAKRFKVEINYVVRERSIDVWFESADLAEMLAADAIDIINKELERFPKEFVFIEQ